MRNNSSTPQIKILTKYSHNRNGSLYLNRHQNTFDNLSLALQTVHSGKRPNGQRKEKGQWRVPSSVHKQFPRLFSLYLYVAFPCQLCNLKRTAKLINTETDHWSTRKYGQARDVSKSSRQNRKNNENILEKGPWANKHRRFLFQYKMIIYLRFV